jgi:hypothetical protein
MTQAAKERGGGGGIPFAGQEGLFFQLRKFGGINTRNDRTDIGDEEFFWLENLMPAAEGELSAMFAEASPIKSVGGKSIIYVKMFNIGSTQYAAVFYSDGTADQVNMAGVTTVISNTPNTFYVGGDLPNVAQWASSGILIVTTAAANGYYAWDGALWPPGNATSPTWLNGGTATAMPTGIKGTYVETYQSRVWIANGSTGFLSAPANGANFSGAAGGGAFPSSDSFLRIKYTALKQSNGFLYLFGDSSVNVISNVQTAGSPLATTFNNQNVDPQVGTPWPASVQVFDKGILFAHSSGVFQLYGGTVTKVSKALDGLFENANFNAVTPSAAVASIFEVRCYFLLFQTTDLYGVTRDVCACWTGERWFLASQVRSLTYIDTQEVNSSLTSWGTDGSSLFQMFQTPSASLRKILQTKLWSGDGYLINKQAMRVYTLGTDESGNGYSLSGTIDMVTETGPKTAPVTLSSPGQAVVWINNTSGVVTWLNNAAQLVTFVAQGLQLFGQNTIAIAPLIGLTLTTVSTDFDLSALTVLYRRLGPIGG